VYEPHALLHADQSQTSLSLDIFEIKALAGIRYIHGDLLGATAQNEPHPGSFGVFAGVSQALLGDPVKAQRNIAGNAPRKVVGIEPGGNAILAGEGCALVL
jgi:hypothetical protein